MYTRSAVPAVFLLSICVLRGACKSIDDADQHANKKSDRISDCDNHSDEYRLRHPHCVCYRYAYGFVVTHAHDVDDRQRDWHANVSSGVLASLTPKFGAAGGGGGRMNEAVANRGSESL